MQGAAAAFARSSGGVSAGSTKASGGVSSDMASLMKLNGMMNGHDNLKKKNPLLDSDEDDTGGGASGNPLLAQVIQMGREEQGRAGGGDLPTSASGGGTNASSKALGAFSALGRASGGGAGAGAPPTGAAGAAATAARALRSPGTEPLSTSPEEMLAANFALRDLRRGIKELGRIEDEVDGEDTTKAESSSKARSRWLKLRAGVKVGGAFKGDTHEQERRLDRLKLAELEREIREKDEKLYKAEFTLKEKVAYFDKERAATHLVVSNAVERYRDAELLQRQSNDLLKASIKEQAALQAEVEQLTGMRAALEERLRDSREEVAGLNLKIEMLSASVTPLEAKVEELTRRCKELQSISTMDEDPRDVSSWDRKKLTKEIETNQAVTDPMEAARKDLLEALACFGRLRPMWEKDVQNERDIYLQGTYRGTEIDEETIMKNVDKEISASVLNNEKMTRDIARYIVNGYRRNQKDWTEFCNAVVRELTQNYGKDGALSWSCAIAYSLKTTGHKASTYCFCTRLHDNFVLQVWSSAAV
ncbi:unnamed protein product [Amoebophrya sp. A25]|nr:unnamed protein product [Amoebophrya sp. A25]|eukprot:GSA25T00008796001.1